MKNLFFLSLLLTSAITAFSQNISTDQVRNNFVKAWKANYMLMNGMRIDAKAGISMIVFEFRGDNTLQTYNSTEPGSKVAGTWKYLADKKRIQVKVNGAEKGFVTSLSNDEMSMEMNTSTMGGDDGSEMILVLSPSI